MERGSNGGGGGSSSLKEKLQLKTEKEVGNVWSGGSLSCGESQVLIASCFDTVVFYDMESHRALHTLAPDRGSITAIAVNNAKSKICIGTSSLQVLSYAVAMTGSTTAPSTTDADGSTGGSVALTVTEEYNWKPHDGAVTSLAFDVTDTLVASGSTDRVVKVWDIQNKYCTHSFRGHEGVIVLVKFHPDPKKLQLFSSASDNTVRIWDLITKKCISTLTDHYSIVTSIEFSQNLNTMVTTGRDQVAIIWDLRNFKSMKTIPMFEPIEAAQLISGESLPPSIAPSISAKNKELLFVAGQSGDVSVYNLDDGKAVHKLQVFQSEKKHPISVMLFSAQSNKLIIGSANQNIYVYDSKSLNYENLLIGYHDEILDIKYIDHSRIGVVSNSEEIKLLNIETMDWKIMEGHSEIVLAIDVSGHVMVSGSKDRSIRLWDTETSNCIAVCEGHTDAVTTVAFSKKTTDFFVSGSRDKTIKLWALSRNQVHICCTEKAHDKDVNALAIAPNDKILASGSQDKQIKLWNINGFGGKSNKSASLSYIGSLKGHTRGIWALDFSPVDKCLISSSSDKTVKLWSVSSLSCLMTFEGHATGVLRTLFINGGTQILSASSEGLLKLWTIKSNECVNTFDVHTDKVWALAVSKDENYVISGGSDSKLIIWKDHTQIDASEKVKETQERILKEQELSNSLHHKNYKKAIGLAFALDQPFKVLTIFETVFNDSGLDSLAIVEDIYESFGAAQLETFMKYVRDWNTNGKHSVVAQKVLQLLFSHFPPSAVEKVPHIKELLEGLLPYTERHFTRIDKLIQKSYVLDYTLQRMNLLLSQPSKRSISEEEEEDNFSKRQKMEVSDV